MKNLNELDILWEQLGEIPVDVDDKIEQQFLNFEIGTDKFDIWHWFEDQNVEFSVFEKL